LWQALISYYDNLMGVIQKKFLIVGIIILVGIVSIILFHFSKNDNTPSTETLSTPTPTQAQDFNAFSTDESLPMSSAELDSEEWNFLDIINEYRINDLGLKTPLKISQKLTEAADWQSNDMAQRQSLSHVDSLGRNIEERFQAFGYTGGAIAENITYSYASAQSAFTSWFNSPGHRRNMGSSDKQVIGIARIPGQNGWWYWTTTFGSDPDTEITRTPTPSIDPTITLSPTITPLPTFTVTPTPTITPSPTSQLTPTPTSFLPTTTNTPTPIPTTPTPIEVVVSPSTTPNIPSNTPTRTLPTATPINVQITATLTPTMPAATTATNTPTPTIANPGSPMQTYVITGGILLLIIGGALLLTL